jgi:DNA repair exonuclease SbcCD nuclease subunit
MKRNNISHYNYNIRVNKIFHISDIHIRLYSRLDEYVYIFDKLYKYIKSYKKTNKNEYNLIVITGDLFHCKNELSPESIMLALSFLETLAAIYPVILIAGNHDALLNNKQRLDSISAILMAKKINNLHYFRYSGVYQIYNILFCVSSLLDNFHITYDFISKNYK